MKKTWKICSILCFTLLTVLLLMTACDKGEQQTQNETTDSSIEQTTEPVIETESQTEPATAPETEPHVHTFGDWTTVKDATCIENGEQQRTCDCGETETQSINALGHTEVIDAAVAPTCTETGLTEGKHCEVCNEVLVAQETVDALGHTEVIDAAVAPTCTETGLTEGKHCEVCNEVLVAQETVDALGHTEVIDAAVAPTCTETGLTEGKHCEACNEVLVAQETVDALGHTEVVDEIIAPTCTEPGLTEVTHCSACDTVFIPGEPIEALGHDHQEYLPERLCEGQSITYQCSRCEDSYTKALTPIEAEFSIQYHTLFKGIKDAFSILNITGGYGSYHVEFLYTDPDGQTLSGSYPDYTDFNTIHILGNKSWYAHYRINSLEKPNIIIQITDEIGFKTKYQIYFPTLEENQYQHNKNDTYTGNFADDVQINTSKTVYAHFFDESSIVKEATCTESGEITYLCTACGHTVNDTLPATGHTVVIDPAVAATCTSTGLTEGSHCKSCNTVLVEQTVVNKLQHAYDHKNAVVISEPTCTSYGRKEAYCSCGAVYTSSIEPLGHREGEWIIDLDATVTEDGARHRNCTVCGDLLDEEIIHATGSLGLSYYYYNNAYSVTGLGTCTDSVIYIPSYYNGKKVTAINGCAFDDCTQIQKVVISDGIEIIGFEAFENCTSLTEIVFGKGIKTVERNAFTGCTAITDVYVSDLAQWCSIKFSPQDANPLMHADQLHCGDQIITTELIIPEGITSISSYAFANFTSLTSITIPTSVTQIGERAFWNCSNLQAMYITDMRAYCEISFEGIEPNPLWIAQNLYLNGELVSGHLEIPEGTKSIGNNAFYYYDKITSVTIPDSVGTIGEYAFSHCAALTSVVIGDGVYNIYERAFYDCTSLTELVLGNSVRSIGYEAFCYCAKLTSVDIPASVWACGEDAFMFCNELNRVNITDMDAWYGIDFKNSGANPLYCAGNLYLNGELITDLVLPEWLYRLNRNIFAGMTCLKTITIPDKLGEIGYGALYGCTNLETIVGGKGLETVAADAFTSCYRIDNIYYYGTASDWNNINIHYLTGGDFDNSAIRYYYSETQPTSYGQYWHYVDGKPTAW